MPASRNASSRNIRIHTAHNVHHTAHRLPCSFPECKRTFNNLSSRTQHIRKGHHEQPAEKHNLVDNLSPGVHPHTQAEHLSSPHQAYFPDVRMTSPTGTSLHDSDFELHQHIHSPRHSLRPRESSPAPRVAPQPALNHWQPFIFEWDEEASAKYDNDTDLEDSECATPSSSQNSHLGAYGEWDEHRGWGPYNDDGRNNEWDGNHSGGLYDDDNNNFADPPTPEPQTPPQSSSKSGEDSVRREYHPSINGNYLP